MSLVHQCDRCKDVSNQGDFKTLPPNWRTVAMLVMGSSGARSTTVVELCELCDDSLYGWFHAND
jgi:hypothetical protein